MKKINGFWKEIDMCGRYVIDIEEKEIREIIKEAVKNTQEEVKTGEIFPTNNAPILAKENEKITPQIMKWGFLNFKGSGVIINSRVETALYKKMFKESLLHRRCVIPSTGFFELKKDSREKFLFKNPASNLLYMAGFYNDFFVDGKKSRRFVILTTSANGSIREVHDRMPLVLEKDQVDIWLDNSEKSLYLLNITPVSLEKIKVD